MRVLAPTVSRRGDRAVLAARFEPSHGDPIDVELGVPRELVGEIDVSATPFLPIATVAAAAGGEDLVVDGAVSPMVLAGARRNVETMARWWGWHVPSITAAEGTPAAATPGRGVGLFFSRGVDSWSSLLTLQAEGPRPTHLLTVRDIELPRDLDTQAEVLAETARIAAGRGLTLVVLSTNARELLDPLDDWTRTNGGVLAGFALLLRPLLAQVYVASTLGPSVPSDWGSHPDLDPNWSSETSELVHHQADLDRTDKIAIVAREQAALDTLLVCWEGGGARNCGRCAKCLRTMTGLHINGALERCPTFDRPLTAEAVRYADRPDHSPFVRELLAHLPPGELRAAWERHLPSGREQRRLVAPPTVGVAGDSMRARVNDALATSTARADPADDGPELVIGWEPGMVPLRPPAGTHRAVRAALAAHPARTVPWVVADLSDQFQRNDPWPSAVAERAERLWGPGLCYLAGIGWGDPTAPVLGPAAVGRLLDAARIRLWWTPAGTLDPLRVVESIEHGCLPLQVMPPGPASLLRPRLPGPLARLVVDIDDMAAVDPASTDELLRDVADVVLAGSAERDLVLAVAGGLVNRG
ncbi:MAG: hypothetical protein JO291_07055 [Acidimicrobiia bacterium]|nr:hypothetical protein [Acidimicrobiia bacterium]